MVYATLYPFHFASDHTVILEWYGPDNRGLWLDVVLLTLVPGSTPDDLRGELLHDATVPVILQKFGGHGVGFLLLGLVVGASDAPTGRVLARLAAAVKHCVAGELISLR